MTTDDAEDLPDSRPIGFGRIATADELAWYMHTAGYTLHSLITGLIQDDAYAYGAAGAYSRDHPGTTPMEEPCIICLGMHPRNPPPEEDGSRLPLFDRCTVGIRSTDMVRSVSWGLEHERVLRQALGLDRLLGPCWTAELPTAESPDAAYFVEMLLRGGQRLPYLSAAVQARWGVEVVSPIDFTRSTGQTLDPTPFMWGNQGCCICGSSMRSTGMGSHLVGHDNYVRKHFHGTLRRSDVRKNDPSNIRPSSARIRL